MPGWWRWWYRFRRSYHMLLLEGCVDAKTKSELERKIAADEMKLNA